MFARFLQINFSYPSNELPGHPTTKSYQRWPRERVRSLRSTNHVTQSWRPWLSPKNGMMSTTFWRIHTIVACNDAHEYTLLNALQEWHYQTYSLVSSPQWHTWQVQHTHRLRMCKLTNAEALVRHGELTRFIIIESNDSSELVHHLDF